MNNEYQTPNSGSQQEPTVLDLFKSVTKDWRSFFNFAASLFGTARRLEIEEEAARVVILEPQQETLPREAATPLPWRAVLALFLALFAQSLLEPPGRRMEIALPLYILAAGFAVWGFVREEFRLPASAPESTRRDPLTSRPVPLVLSALFGALAFLDFGGNLFTITNVTLWLIAMGLFVYALWLPAPRQKIVITQRTVLWFALILAAIGLSIFFRFNRIGGIPAEPFSDHAEKILDVYDISQGQTHIFFPRNTGREAIQMYWTLLVSQVFGTGLSFLSLKIGTALLGLFTLPYLYLLGKELGSPRAGLFAMFLFGIGYWPNVISRIGLRFPLYPLFVAPTLLYLMRGLRTRSRNDFILCGLFLGLGLHGYSPFRIIPIAVVIFFALYILHLGNWNERRQALLWLAIVGLTSLMVFLPLLRYWADNPGMFSYRAFSRLGGIETPLPGPALQVFFSNLWKALLMFNWDDGEIWVNSLPHRPALDVVTGALFLLGVVLLIARYIHRRDWRDIFLLLSIPLLLMPSILSLAFPGENPALNRAGGAAVPAFVISGLALDGLAAGLGSGKRREFLAYGLTGILFAASAFQNYDLVFHQFNEQFRAGAWNTSEMGQVIQEFGQTYGETDTVWIVPYPHWVDTRLPGVWAGIPNRDFAVWPEDLSSTREAPYPKLFIFRPEDQTTEQLLKELYPGGSLTRHTSSVPGKDFMIYFVEK